MLNKTSIMPQGVPTMKLTISLFAGIAETIGDPQITLNIAQTDITVAELKKYLIEQFPHAAEMISLSFIAVNRAYAAAQEHVREEDELALIPPVSGGETKTSNYTITSEAISVEQVTSLVIIPENGAALCFVGTTREYTLGKRTVLLEYEAYIPMALATLEQIGREIELKWPGTLCAITHRLGKVGIGEISVVIAVSSPHREASYEASRYAIERLKQIVPIWKKEIWDDGSEWKGHQQGPWNPLAQPLHKEGQGYD
jgi:molybdopterin converting factor subunit 1